MNWYKTAKLESNPFAPDPRDRQNPISKIPSKKPIDPKKTLEHTPPPRKVKEDMMPMREQVQKLQSNPVGKVDPKKVPNQKAVLQQGKYLDKAEDDIMNQITPDLSKVAPTFSPYLGNPATKKSVYNLLEDTAKQQNPGTALTPVVNKMKSIIDKNIAKPQEHKQQIEDLQQQTETDQQEAHGK